VPRGAEPRTIPVDHPVSVLARVYRTRHALLVDDGVLVSEFEVPFRDGALLAVPILWTTPEGGLPVGVICLSGRRGGLPFTAGDEKFIAAIGSQIGSAIQNGVLVRQSLEQERLASEMRLATDLQQRLLPKGTAVAPEARCAARVEAAEGVGGDFYHLFRLDGGSTGVLLGDVSGHGYRAALVMALVMSAAAIHARGSDDPARTVEAILATVGDELADTEMFLSLCYVIVDHRGGVVRWTNTGHPHAFVIRGDGRTERLAATDPALGLGTEPLRVASSPWDPAEDLLAIFTDGVSDARDVQGRALGEAAVLDVLVARRREVPSRIVDGVFAQVSGHLGRVRPHDDQAVVVLRSA
jgi:sigma-B regulation protein RsbU (phosphoserine phosphatase)